MVRFDSKKYEKLETLQEKKRFLRAMYAVTVTGSAKNGYVLKYIQMNPDKTNYVIATTPVENLSAEAIRRVLKQHDIERLPVSLRDNRLTQEQIATSLLAIAAADQYLKNQLGPDWTLGDVQGDGSCMFHAVRAALRTDPKTSINISANRMRHQIAASLEDPNFQEFWSSNGIQTESQKKRYAKQVKDPRFFGGSEELAVLSALYNFIPIVLSLDNLAGSQCADFLDWQGSREAPKFLLLYLFYGQDENSHHYNLIYNNIISRMEGRFMFYEDEVPLHVLEDFYDSCERLAEFTSSVTWKGRRLNWSTQ